MKRIIPFALLFLLVGTFGNAFAANQNRFIASSNNVYNNSPITFNENGIVFHVYQNGTFNFDTPDPRYGMGVGQDNLGRVTSVGNTYITYDYQNRVNQIGNIYMSYNQYALIQIGGMQLVYDYQGNLINMIGAVNNYGNVYPVVNHPVYNPRPYVRMGYNPYYRRNVYYNPNVYVNVQAGFPIGGGGYHNIGGGYHNMGSGYHNMDGGYHIMNNNFPRGGGNFHNMGGGNHFSGGGFAHGGGRRG